MARPLLTLRIDGLELSARIGVHAHEEAQPQPVRLFLRAQLEQPRAPSARVCYDALVARLRECAADGHTPLLEQLAEKFARALLQDRRIKKVQLRLEKPHALRAQAQHAGAAPLVSVELTRLRPRQRSPKR